MKGYRLKQFLIPALLMPAIMLSCSPSREYLLSRNMQGSADKKYVRVLICSTDDRVTVATGSRLKVTNKKTRKIIYESGNTTLVIYPEKVKSPIIIESGSGNLKVNGTPYRGTLEVHNILGKLAVINCVRLNHYLYSVVPGEIPAGWETEALKAQAVAARTYTYYHLIKNMKKRNIYDLDSTSHFQVYSGMRTEKQRTTEAVNATRGEVITYSYEPIAAYFHSTCGGMTIDDRYVWKGNDLDYIRSVRCPYCEASPQYKWESNLTLHEIQKYLKKRYKKTGSIIKISLKKKNGRVTELKIRHTQGTITISGNDFRLLFPPKTIRSMFFSVKKDRYGIVLQGRGWGHGVGMCQWGAKGMAAKGAGYRSILKYYYKNVKITGIDSRYIAKRMERESGSHK